MAEKRYYWLKLQRDFFKRHDIKIIESMPNGKDYVLFYLKLLVESIDHDGKLRFSDTIPYNEDMLSTITDTNIDVVRSAMKLFIDLKMIEVLEDSTIFMAEIEQMLGCETSVAERVRNHRAKQKLLQCNADVTPCNSVKQNGNTEKEIEKELELDKEKDKSTSDSPTTAKLNYDEFRTAFILSCPSLPAPNSADKWSASRKKAIREKNMTANQMKAVFVRIEKSDFLSGRSGKWTGCSIDWILNPANWQKITEGNYDNREQTKPQQKKNHGSYDLDEYERMSNSQLQNL